ncbi:hypothetical protein B0H13DRAFT_2303449 [Mycena leptocephala]|nr:hypothetical protein B0H13DRAFT_2303449 [Mycena leptocephala]
MHIIPVEILHVILLRTSPWKSCMSFFSGKDDKKELLTTRLSSLDVSGLGISPLAGKTLVQYSSSLTGRDFSAIALEGFNQPLPEFPSARAALYKHSTSFPPSLVSPTRMVLCFVSLTRVDSLRRYFFKLNAGNWRRAEAPCMRGSDELEDSRELEDSEGTRWLERMGSKDVRANASISLHAGQIPLLCVGSSVLEVRDLGTVADVLEDDLVIDVDENEVGPTTGRDAGSGTCKDDVDDRNINEGGVDNERADLWGRETYRIFDSRAV